MYVVDIIIRVTGHVFNPIRDFMISGRSDEPPAPADVQRVVDDFMKGMSTTTIPMAVSEWLDTHAEEIESQIIGVYRE